MLSSDVAAHEMQVTQDNFEYSRAFGFMNHSDWYRCWVLSWNKLGIKSNEGEGKIILTNTRIVDQKNNL